MNPSISWEAVATIAAAFLSFGLGYLSRRYSKQSKRIRNKLEETEQTLKTIREALSGSRIVRRYEQPVLLIGPRYVGKSSLLKQWEAPWELEDRPGSPIQRTAHVPFRDDHKELPQVPHFADPTLNVDVTGHFALRVHDFRGEADLQDLPLAEAKTESEKIRGEHGGRAGVVLVFMFDATEAIDHKPSKRTDEYYANKLFGDISLALQSAAIFVRRVIVVYNKFDQLESALPDESHGVLLARCGSTFKGTIDKINDTFQRHDVRTVATVLSTTDDDINTKNASIVLGYAADGFVKDVIQRLQLEDAEQPRHDARPKDAHAPATGATGAAESEDRQDVRP